MFSHPFGRPAAIASMLGDNSHPGISGAVSFYPTASGTLVVVNLNGLPHGNGPCDARVFGFHIHEGTACTGADFSDAGSHFDPHSCPHPYHSGDLPPIFECSGRAYMAVLTGRFQVSDIIGRAVILHDSPDDFHTQPSGHSGNRIACGVIRRV